MPVQPLASDFASQLLFLVPVLLALAGATLLATWLRRLAGRHGSPLFEELIRELSPSLRALLLLIGLRWTIALLPLRPRLIVLLGHFVYLVAVLVGARLLARGLVRLLRAYVEARAEGEGRERAQRQLLPLAQTTVTVGVGLSAAIVAAHHFGQDVTSLVTALGIGSLAIGLAAQQTLGNMFAGFTLLVDSPFRPGDRVRLESGEIGEVETVGIRSTRILLDDQNLLVVPNSLLANSRLVNFTLPTPRSRGEVRLKLPWPAVKDHHIPLQPEPSLLLPLLVELATAQPEVVATPTPEAVVIGFTDHGIEVALRFTVAAQSSQRSVEERIRGLLLDRLQSASPLGAQVPPRLS